MKASRNQLSLVRSLRTAKGRRESGLFLVEGARLCGELAATRLPVEFALLSEGATDTARAAADNLRRAGVAVLDVAASQFEPLSDTESSQGILAAARWTEIAPAELRFGARGAVLALDAVNDPGNVGTVIRTAAWFGADAVLLGQDCADLLNPKTVRATMGAMFHLPVCRAVDLSAELARMKAAGFSVVAATMDGSPDWRTWAAAPKTVLVLGSEARGIAPGVLASANRRITIPRRGAGESLNVAITAGVLLCALA